MIRPIISENGGILGFAHCSSQRVGQNQGNLAISGKYVEERGVDLFNEVCQRNLEGVVAKRKTGTYSTISGWLKIKNPNYTQSERRHELFESFKAKSTNSQRNLPPIPKKPRWAITVPKKVDDKSPARAGRSRLRG